MFNTILLVTLFCFSTSFSVSNPLFWKGTKGKSTVYFLGSVHIGTEDMFPLPSKIIKALDQSSKFIMEVDIQNVHHQELQTYTMQKSMLPGDSTLYMKLSAPDVKKLEDAFSKLGVPLSAFSKFRPWMPLTTYTVLYMQKLGFQQGYGTEQYLKNMYPKKPIVALEEAKAQVDMLSESMSDSSYISYSIKEMGAYDTMVQELIQAWIKGDEKKLHKILFKDMELEYAKKFYDLMFFKRNKDMAEKIRTIAKTKDTYFVVVGAAHLIGKGSILDELKKEGFEIVSE